MSPDRILKLKSIFMQTALQFASMSFATRKKVGAIIVKNESIISTGWNGLPSGMPNEEIEIWSDLEQEKITNPLVIHAEANAIARCNESSEECDMYITLSPCLTCSNIIIKAGIKNVYYRTRYSNTEGIEFLLNNNINVTQME